MLQIFDTMARKMIPFLPTDPNNVLVYQCGPTPYDYAHIGNLRTYIFEDIVTRSLRFLGYTVHVSMNITDIDDKTIRRSGERGIPLLKHTKEFTDAFLEDLSTLGIQLPEKIVPISTLIPEMVTIINWLLAKNHAYLADDGSIYFSINTFSEYGKLSHMDRNELRESVRISNDEYDKEQAADFALWKKYDPSKDGPNQWPATFCIDGKDVTISGRPGWHIECSACNLHCFGEQIDLHMGAVDNIFPHHENEIAQTEAYTGKQFSRHWIHGGHLLVNNTKMSKSLKNFFTFRDILTKFPDKKSTLVGRAFRLMVLQTRYRDWFNFTLDRLGAAITTIEGLDETLRRLGRSTSDKLTSRIDETIGGIENTFRTALEDDFATPEALSAMFAFFTDINRLIDSNEINNQSKQQIISALEKFDNTLVIMDFSYLREESAPADILDLLNARNDAKKNKNFAQADALRDEILKRGWKIVDTKEKTFVESLSSK